MSTRSPRNRRSADMGPAIAIVMRDQDCDVDTAARLLKDEAARLGVSIAEVAASTVAADAATEGGADPPSPRDAGMPDDG